MDVLARKSLGDVQNDLKETRKVVEIAESRARLRRGGSNSKVLRRNERQFAEALHREADQLYYSGDYEAALVLYHRAARVYPRDSGHGTAARRTAATISSWSNPPRAVRKLLPDAGSEAELAVSLCPELAALRAAAVLQGSPNASSIPELLKYFDCHKSLWTTLPSVPSSPRPPRAKGMSRRTNSAVNATLRNLEAAFESGKIRSSLKFAKELLSQSTELLDPHRYQIAAYHYLSLIHVALGRHDRAVSNVARMVHLSRISKDSIMFSRALVTLGKVHLSFGHLDAVAKAWENLSGDLEDPVPRAWIHHEIGRCYLETGRYRRALKASSRCLEAAEEVDSQKWILHGRLLKAQAMLKMGRFAEALEELKVCERITEEEGDTPMLCYVQDLVAQVTRALRKVTIDREDFLMDKIHESIEETERRGTTEVEGSKVESSNRMFNKNNINLPKEVLSRKSDDTKDNANALQATRLASSFKYFAGEIKLSKKHSSLELEGSRMNSFEIDVKKLKPSSRDNQNILNLSHPIESSSNSIEADSKKIKSSLKYNKSTLNHTYSIESSINFTEIDDKRIKSPSNYTKNTLNPNRPIESPSNSAKIDVKKVKPSSNAGENLLDPFTKGSAMTTVFAKRSGREGRAESSSRESSEDESEEISVRSGMTSMQSPYQGWSSRRGAVLAGEKPSDEAILGGGTTFRISSPARARGIAEDSSLSSSSSSSVEEEGHKRKFQDALEDLRRDASSVEGGPGSVDFSRGQIKSPVSVGTGETYVIDGDRRSEDRGGRMAEERRDLEESGSFHSVEETFRTRVLDARDSMNFYSNGSTVSRSEIETLFKKTQEESEELSRMITGPPSCRAVEVKDDWTEELRLLEELDDEEGKELLEILRKMMSTTDELSPHGGGGSSEASVGGGLATARLRERRDDELTVESILRGKAQEHATSHALYRHSLPPSPRKREVDEVSHTCEGCTKSYGSS